MSSDSLPGWSAAAGGEATTRGKTWRRSGVIAPNSSRNAERSIATMRSLLGALRTRYDEQRQATQRRLRSAMEDLKRGPTEEFNRVLADVNQGIRRLVENEQDAVDQLAGLAGIDALLEVEPTAAQLAQFGSLLRLVLRNTSEKLTVHHGTRTLGRLARVGGVLTADLVEREAKRALELLGEREARDTRLYASALVIKELARGVPALLSPHVKQCTQSLWTALRDPSPYVREAGAEALRATLVIVASQSEGRSDELMFCWDQCKKALQPSAQAHIIHGGLLCVGDVFTQAAPYLYSKFQEAWNMVWTHRSHPQVQIRVQVLRLLPVIARTSQNQFVPLCCNAAVDFLVGLFSKADQAQPGQVEKAAAFNSLADVAEAAGVAGFAYDDDRKPRCETCLRRVRDYLDRAREQKASFVPESLVCYTRIAAMLPEGNTRMNQEREMSQSLEPLFAFGVSLQLAEALRVLVDAYPALKPKVQERLLHALTRTLTGQAAGTQPRAEDVTRALTVCRMFELSRSGIPEFVRGCVMRYLDDENPTLRKEAALTCACIVVPLPREVAAKHAEAASPPVPASAARVRSPSQQTLSAPGASVEPRSRGSSQIQPTPTATPATPVSIPAGSVAQVPRVGWDVASAPTRGHTGILVGEVVERLLAIAVADPDPRIRLATFSSLDGRFARHLVSQDSLRMLFISLNDEVFEIRELVTELVGRLAQLNPGYVLPCVRKHLLQLLNTLEYSVDLRSQEEALRTFTKLITAAPLTLRMYTQSIVETLKMRMPELMEESGVAVAFLDALAATSEAVGEDMAAYLNDFLPVVIGVLHDKSSRTKLTAALRALGSLVQFTGYVVKPYEQYPELLPLLFSVLRADADPGADSDPTAKREAVRVLGIIGALDPYRRNMQLLESNATLPEFVSYKSDNYFTKMAVRALVEVMKDTTLAAYHKNAVPLLVSICRCSKAALPDLLPIVVPPFIEMVRQRGTETDLAVTRSLLAQLSSLVPLCKENIKKHLPAFHALICGLFDSAQLLPVVLHLIANLADACPAAYKAYLPPLLPRVLLILRNEGAADETLSLLCLHILACLREHLNDFLHQVIPVLMQVVAHEGPELPPHFLTVRSAALKTLRRVGRDLRLEDHAAAIVHPLLRVMSRHRDGEALRADIMGLLCLLVIQLGSDYAIFIPIVHKVVTREHYSNDTLSKYDKLIRQLLKNQPLPGYDEIDMDSLEVHRLHEMLQAPLEDVPELKDEPVDASAEGQVLPVNAQEVTKKANECHSVVGRDGWVRWLHNFSMELLNQSPHLALRKCANLASQFQAFARDLFNAAFVSVWTQLSDRYHVQLSDALERCFKSTHLPTDVLGVLLNLVEFMDANGLTMSLDTNLLSNLAHTKTHALAKALRWKEIAFQSAPQACIEELIRIYHTLNQQDSALGLLEVARRDLDIKLKESWYELLGRWEDALRALGNEQQQQQLREREMNVMRRHQHTPSMDGESSMMMTVSRMEPYGAIFDKMEKQMSAMRCLKALGEWKQLHLKCKDAWDESGFARTTQALSAEQEEDEEGDTLQHAIAPLATAAAWHMGDWEFMAEAVEKLPPASHEYYFHRAILALQEGDAGQVSASIARARDCLAQELTALVGESYSRSYHCLVQAQQLAELEEINLMRNMAPEQQQLLRATWLARLRGCASSVRHWNDLLQVRTLMLAPVSDCDTWLKFVSLCRNQGQHHIEAKTLLALLGHDSARGSGERDFDPELLVTRAQRYNPKVSFAFLKHLWAVGERPKAYNLLSRLVGLLKTQKGRDCPAQLLARCCHKLGDWLPEAGDVEEGGQAASASSWYEEALSFDKGWYKAWHSWALACHGAAAGAAAHQQIDYVVSAIEGYIKSVTIGPNNSSVLQDVLRLLTLWFQFGGQERVERALREGFELVKLDVWLLVIPQIIARAHTSERRIANLLRWLLCRIGREFPQALVWPLTVCIRSTHSERRAAAAHVLTAMREQAAVLVDECEFVGNELIRVAVLWHEQWNEGLEEASKLFFGAKDVEGMLRTVFPLHAILQRTDTLHEVSFIQAYGRDLQEAYEWCRSYLRTGDDQDINQAWDIYYTVFKKIHKSLQKDLMSLELQFCSPRLFHARDLIIAMPGLPAAQSAVDSVRIKSFSPLLQVMQSKQRPRRMSIYGSDGVEYKFLLKGKEDLRLDERVMQVFGLVNALLQSDGATAMKPALQIQRYSVTPLSSNAGLIGWVDACDTLHMLVKDFREKNHRMRINVEYQHMMQLCYPQENAYENLPLMNKVELFEYAMEHTTGQDLYKILWLQSGTAEVWNERRASYTLSLATMSMVGYILGLGDRHPNNLMLQRVTGKIVHIDFGDCFEVAMLRDKFPERIPFRLTRMLRNAMEVSGIEGNYRCTCEHVMRVLREHKDSVMAMLEAFVHDPLLQWRLLGGKEDPKKGKSDEAKEEAREEAEVKNLEMRRNIITEYIKEQKEETGWTLPPRNDRAAEERELKSHSPEVSGAGESTSHKGVTVLCRIADKLRGRDFDKRGRARTAPHPEQIPPDDLDAPLAVEDQVDRLIKQATNVENLCQCYIGWCPFW
eukprot:TRINITY_DN2131_c0_g1_i1.p1 TRINITY_DN2131_c0_g1~~TRINITY_DN2131_c0_g1_i1.p1  ORF type:complete len:2623 (+),score=1020.62 TRINITY_DN2131_c0_g1_i1:162-7871(+)